MKETIINVSNLLQKTILRINDDTFIVPLESHEEEKMVDCEYWSCKEPNKFYFSDNIEVLMATYLKNGGAVIVRKKNMEIVENLVIFDGEKNVNIGF